VHVAAKNPVWQVSVEQGLHPQEEHSTPSKPQSSALKVPPPHEHSSQIPLELKAQPLSSRPTPQFLSAHAMHAVAPICDEYVPSSHTLQGDDPASALKKPGVQGSQMPSLLEEHSCCCCPPGHWRVGQSTHALESFAASDVEYFPASHCTHADDPLVALYPPALHAPHAPPSGPVYPALQRHSDSEVLPSGDVESAGQLPEHAAMVGTPTSVPYVPAGQSVQGPPSLP